MVESTQKYKSLSADSELSSAYDLLNKGEYSQCNRIIKKKMPKLKSPIDKANFNILKILLLDKTKKNKEKTQLLSDVKAQFLSNAELISDSSLVSHFKRILRSFDDDKGAQELFKLQMKKMNFTTMDKKEQYDILKELTLNFDFSDIYSKVSNFIKNPNDSDVNFLLLLKYEAVYFLFLNKKLSDKMTTKIFGEMIGNFEKLKNERGYFDLIAQYSIALKDTTNFLTYFEEKRAEFTNAPVDDLKFDIYLSQGKTDLIIQNLIQDIVSNRDKCNFNSFERIINVTFWYIKTQLKVAIDISKISMNFSKDYPYKEVTDMKDTTKVINGLFNLFEDIKAQSGRNLNAFKSGVVAQLLIYHNIIISNKVFTKEIRDDIYNLIISLLDKSVSKHSIIFEVSKYLIYLDAELRKSLLEKYSDLMKDNDVEKNVFYYKLLKLLEDKQGDTKHFTDRINELIEKYLQLTIGEIPLEKGERIPCDDLIVLANEYYYENISLHDSNELTYSLVICNMIAHGKSPYNYDISYYLLKSYSHINLSSETLDVLKYMNMKGPQFETVSYIAFPSFINSAKGMRYLIDNNLRWQNDNREKCKSTLWKMFLGRNFWNSEEIIQFITVNQSSYYTCLLEYFNLVILLNDCYFPHNQNQDDPEDNLNDYLSALSHLIASLEEKEKNNNILKNQDLLVSIHKYCFEDYKYFNNNFDLLTSNENYSKANYRFDIDNLNKENNYIYHLYPGYKNNYLKQDKISVFGVYDSIGFLKLKMNCLNLFGNINSMDIFKELLVKYSAIAKDAQSQIDIILTQLSDIFVATSEDFDLFEGKEEEINALYAKVNGLLTNEINALRKGVSFDNYKSIRNFLRLFNEIKDFYCVPFTMIASKLLDLITQNKKKLKDPNKTKAKLNESFKSPFINMLKENMRIFDLLISNANKNEIKDIIQENALTQTMKENYQEKVKDINGRMIESLKDIIKEVKDNSKKMEEYVKQRI